jgi:hypothetical protein
MLITIADPAEQPATHLKALLERNGLTEGQRRCISRELSLGLASEDLSDFLAVLRHTGLPQLP